MPARGAEGDVGAATASAGSVVAPESAAGTEADDATGSAATTMVGADTEPSRWWRRGRRVPWEVVGLAAVVMMFIGAAGSYALQVYPFYGTDERAHLGYSHEIAAGRLPEIETWPDVPEEATEWRQAFINETRDDAYRTIWVANHPPLHYVLTAPLMWLSDAEGRPDGGLMYMRFANIVFAAVGLVFTYLLTVELSGGLRRLGLAAATIVGLLPRGLYEFSQGLNDGLGFAAATATIWAGVRYIRRGHSRNALLLLGGTVAAAAATRAATMALAFAVVGVVAVVAFVRNRGTIGERLRPALKVLAGGIAPAVVLVGWFYLRNWALYGDLGGSSYLLERFDRTYQGSPIEIFLRWDLWVFIFQALPIRSLISVPMDPPATTFVSLAVIVAAIGMLIVVWTRRTGDTDDFGRAGDVDRSTLALGAITVLVIMATLAQHVSGGGAQSTRYVFPVLAVLGAFLMLGLDRVVPRVLPLAAIVLQAVWTAPYKAANVASDVEATTDRVVDMTSVGTAFTVGFTIVGLAIAVGVLAAGAVSPYLERRRALAGGTDTGRGDGDAGAASAEGDADATEVTDGEADAEAVAETSAS